MGYVDSINHKGSATFAKSRNGWGYVDSINHRVVATVTKYRNGCVLYQVVIKE